MDARSLTVRCAFLWLILIVPFTPVSEAKKKPPLHPINLNTANSEQLQEVPGIGPATADKILNMRKSYGSFKSVDDLRAIKGIGPKRLEKMRKYLTVGKSATKDNSVSPQNSTSTTSGKAQQSPPRKQP